MVGISSKSKSDGLQDPPKDGILYGEQVEKKLVRNGSLRSLS